MDNWVLCIELDGEWETCGFPTRTEAMATFLALAQDYNECLKTAVLTVNRPPHFEAVHGPDSPTKKTYVN